jgi:tetratricopeptide (TPR) repeat protein
MLRKSVLLVCLGLLGLVGVSCRQSPDVVYQKSVTEAQTLLGQGETNRAVGVLRGLFDNKRFAMYRPNLLSSMLQFQLGAGDVAGAQSLFLEVADRDPVLAASTVGMIEGTLLAQGQNEELVAWCVRLQAYAFEEGVLINLADQHFRALAAAGKGEEIPAALIVYLGKLKEGAALGLAQGQFGNAMGAGRPADAERIMAAIEKHVADSPLRKGALVGMKVDLLIAGNDGPAAAAYLRKNLDQIPDDSAVRNLRVIGDTFMKAGDLDAADGLAGFVLENVKGRAGVREAAAAVWVKTAEKRGGIPVLINRLVELKTLGFTPSFILDQTDGVYSLLLDKGKKEDFGPLYALCDSFYTAANDEGVKRRLIGVLLDLGFYLEKYEESLKLVETGMKGSDPDQTAMLVWKIKGHLALQKGQTQEAVKNFREFMACIAKGSGYDFDPIDNTRVTKDMILGLNAKRIGDILAKAGDQAEASKAYAEAREDYAKALKEFPDAKTKEHQKIQVQMAEIPVK